MKGLVVTKNKKICLVDDIPIPEVGPYEALVKIECCMICNGTDLGVIDGKVREVDQYPVVLGHEDSGRVIKTGEKVISYQIDDRVLRAGQHNTSKYSSAWGGFAEYGIIKDYKAIIRDGAEDADALLGITQQICPQEMKPEDASLLITLKETYSALKRLKKPDAERMLIIGDGPVALAFLVCAKLQGVKEIFIVGNHKEKLEVAKHLGASQVYMNRSTSERKALEKLYGSIPVCIDTIGANETIEQCMDYMCCEGIIAVYGLKSEEKLCVKVPTLRNFSIQYVQWPIPEMEAEAHIPLVNAILNGEIDTEAFITHHFSIEEYEKGFQAIHDRTALKVVLDFR